MSDQFIPFSQHIDTVAGEKPSKFEATPVAHEEALEEMRGYVLSYYEGMDVSHSYMDDHGNHWDCVPVEQQCSVKNGQTELVMDAPEAPDHPDTPADAAVGKPSNAPEGEDKAGNARVCPEGHIPVRRLTLEEMTQYPHLNAYKLRNKAASHRSESLPTTAGSGPTHKWAHAYQWVNNTGLFSWNTIWNPQVNTSQSQIFSLSQIWLTGGSGSALQTIETGWQVYPNFYNTTLPALFIFYTPDDYASGCYNLECTAFVQTNSSWHLGGALDSSKISTQGGTQYYLGIQWWLTGGNWWLYLQYNDGTKSAVGYYPTSIYNGGQLATQGQEIDFGGEVVGTTSWPPMGSGQYASKGAGYTGSQLGLTYYTASGGGAANVTASATSSCYTANVISNGTQVLFGGPGGTGC